jgi:hypothetical protein
MLQRAVSGGAAAAASAAAEAAERARLGLPVAFGGAVAERRAENDEMSDGDGVAASPYSFGIDDSGACCACGKRPNLASSLLPQYASEPSPSF